MYPKLFFCIFLLLFPVAVVVGQDDGPAGTGDAYGPVESDAKMVSGMSVLGNNEAPMSLFIVPWKSSELGVETNLNRTLNERDVPVDRDVFLRELAFHVVSVGSNGSAPAAASQTPNPR